MTRFAILMLLVFSARFTYSQNWQEYNDMYKHYHSKQVYDSALIYIAKAVSAYEEGSDNNDSVYFYMLSNLGEVQGLLLHYPEAVAAYKKSNTFVMKAFGKNDLYIYNSEKIADILEKSEDYKNSEKYLLEVLELKESRCKWCSESMDYIGTYLKLTRLYVKMRQFNDADKMFPECRTRIQRILGKNNLEYINICSELAEYNKKRRNYKDAEALYIESMELRKNLNGEKDTAYANDCENLALLYDKLGRYAEAEILIINSLNIFLEILGNSHSEYIEAVDILATIYKNSGQYATAEPYYLELKETAEKLYGNEHPMYADRCNDLALLYAAMGNYKTAEPLYFEAKNIREKVFGKNNIEYAKICNNIATLYIKMFDYESAEPLLIESKEIKETLDGKESASYANSCNNLAYVYMQTGKYQQAEKLFNDAVKINENKFGKSHINYLKACNNLSSLYISMENYKAAEKILLEIKDIALAKLGETHPYYAEICNNLAKLYRLTNKLALARPVYIESISSINNIILKSYGLLTEQEKEMYYKGFEKNYDDFNAFALIVKDNEPDITAFVYNNTINNKGMLLKSSTALRYSILNSNDSALLAKYDDWMELKRQIAEMYSLPVYERAEDLEKLEMDANNIEKLLIRDSKVFADAENEKTLTWENVKESLKSNEAAIEFIDFKFDDDSTYYCALIVKPDSQYPKMIKLFEEKQLQKIFGKFLMNNLKYINSLYGQQMQGNSKLYDLIWKPIEAELQGCDNIYISPSGLLHKISFPALCKEQNVFLCDLYNVNLESSTAKLLVQKQVDFSKINAMIVGGVQYSTSVSENNIWTYLPGTKAETDSITKILSNINISCNYNFDVGANEKTFKNDAAEYNVMHISTHGFFYPDPEEMLLTKVQKQEKIAEETRASANGEWGFGMYAFAMNRNPLMRSGLVLAGANDVWNKGAFPQAFVEDGVLTANEVAQLNMLNMNLVVLSACETGLGDIRGSEGVYGLQRAFKLAGVDYIIMSLWKVADKETKEFMTLFYSILIETKDVKTAFFRTQKEMRNKYDPYFWAAFVLVE